MRRRHHTHGCSTQKVIHRWISQHQIEVEVTPARAEINYRDEAYVDPMNTQVRFVATVYNASSSNVRWQVINGSGHAGEGSVDADGLYTAPIKGTRPYAMTDIVVATSMDDPQRRAYALVNLVGFGPEVPPEPRIEVYPRTAQVYYNGNISGAYNHYIDQCNKEQVFRTITSNAGSDLVVWRKGGSVVGSNDPWYQLTSDWSGSGSVILLTAELKDHPGISDTAIVRQTNYYWPGIS